MALGTALAPVQSASAGPLHFAPFWVQNHRVTDLWSGPDGRAQSYGPIPQWSYLQVARAQEGPRLYVYVPWTDNYAYVDAEAVGPSGPPPGGGGNALGGLLQPAPHLWQGTVRAETLVIRSAPHRKVPIIAELPHGTPVTVDDWVEGEELSPDITTWARLGPNLFGYSAAIQIAVPDEPPPRPTPSLAPSEEAAGRWIDVNLTRQIVTAYEGRQPVRIAITSSGRPTWRTPTGTFRILRRVEDETMDGSTLLALDLNEVQRRQTDYRLTGVLHTQYFTWDGTALHYNYWLPDWAFGVPRSHGCLGLRLADSSFLWNWASLGTPIVIHP
ncbi:MAG: L,D-transpeptidase family protein [Chloroflexi bacterium]|nr:L,D-transpeptidase family protein [Chloroflexota bacterium]